MSMLSFLGMLSDLSFYYAFAGMIAVAAGGSRILIFLSLFLLSLSRGASDALLSHGKHRLSLLFAVLSSAVVLLVTKGHRPDLVLQVPVCCLLVCRTLKQKSTPDADRQKVNLILALCLMLMVLLWCYLAESLAVVFSLGLPLLLVMSLATLLYVRLCRMPETVLENPRFELLNLGIACAPLLQAILLTTRPVRAFLSAVGLFLWRFLLRPVLSVLLYVLSLLLYGIAMLLSFLFRGNRVQMPDLPKMPGNSMTMQPDAQAPLPAENGISLAFLKVLIPAVLFVLGVVFLTRFLNRGGVKKTQEIVLENEDALPEENRNRKKRQKGSLTARRSESRVRAAYRKYLHWAKGKGMERELSDTSLSIEQKTDALNPESRENVSRLRSLYLKARYDGVTSAEDARLAEELVRKILST